MAVGPRDHNRPRCGDRGVVGFSGGRRWDGRPSRKGDGGTGGPVGAGAVEPSGRAAAATVGTVEAPRAIGCGTGEATKVAWLAGAGCCRAVGAA